MGTTPQPAAPSSGGLAPNIAALLGYLIWFLAIVWLLIEPFKNDRFVRFHAYQSLGFFFSMVVLWIAVGIVSFILAFIPYLGGAIALLLYPVMALGLLATWLFLMYKAFNNQMWKLPFIGDFAEKYAG
ncbi:MAG: DUF4870 domain-containing protein [Acidobacteria bacterium]|nr:DUF4870 domain-containing protein [Acidobacteriota bacterium]